MVVYVEAFSSGVFSVSTLSFSKVSLLVDLRYTWSIALNLEYGVFGGEKGIITVTLKLGVADVYYACYYSVISRRSMVAIGA